MKFVGIFVVRLIVLSGWFSHLPCFPIFQFVVVQRVAAVTIVLE